MMKSSFPVISPISPIPEDLLLRILPELEKLFPGFEPNKTKDDSRRLESTFTSLSFQDLQQDYPLNHVLLPLFSFLQQQLQFDQKCKISGVVGCYLRTSGMKVDGIDESFVSRIIFNFNCNEIYSFAKNVDTRDRSSLYFGKNTYMVAPMTNRLLLVPFHPKNTTQDYSQEHNRIITRTVIRPLNYQRFTIVIDIIDHQDKTLEGLKETKDQLTDTLDSVISMKKTTKNKRKKKKQALRLQEMIRGTSQNDNKVHVEESSLSEIIEEIQQSSTKESISKNVEEDSISQKTPKDSDKDCILPTIIEETQQDSIKDIKKTPKDLNKELVLPTIIEETQQDSIKDIEKTPKDPDKDSVSQKIEKSWLDEMD